MYRGPGQARSARPGVVVPHSRELVPPIKVVVLKVSDLFYFEEITKCDVFRVFHQNDKSRIVMFCHAKKSRIVTVFLLVVKYP